MLNTNIEQSNNVLSDYRERQTRKKTVREAQVRRIRYIKIGKRIAYWVIGLSVVISGGWLLVNTTSPKGEDYSQGFSILGKDHIVDGSTVSYNSNPPTSGDHYAVAADAGFYAEELPDEQLVHNLEHGHVWIAYKPDLPEEIIKNLKNFSGANVIVTPRFQNDTDIALVAWGRLDKFNVETNSIDNQRVRDFIFRYQNKGPERINP